MQARHLRVLPLISCLLLPVPLHSQQADSVALLRELAVVLATGGSLDAVLRLGQAPPSLPPEVLDPRARILGSLDEGHSSRTVILVPGFPDSVRSALSDRLEKAGWIQPPDYFNRAGFVNPRMAVVDRICRGQESLMPMITAREARQSLITLYYTKEAGGECRADVAMDHNMSDPRPMPRLYPAFGLSLEGGGVQHTTTSGWYSTATLTTRLSMKEILAHYAGQLERAGWTAGDKAEAPTLLAQSWRYADSSGTWLGVFLVSGSVDNLRREVSFSMSRGR